MASYILAVDNNEMNLEFISYLLRAKGYRVRTARTVTEGLEMMRGDAPELIISDLNLPERGGFDFLREVKDSADWKGIPFLIISATSWLESDVKRAKRLGAARYLFRPLEPQALLDEIESSLKEHRKKEDLAEGSGNGW